MAVVLGSLSEGLRIGVSGLGTEQLGLLPVPGNTLAPEVAEVGAKRRGLSGVPHDARLDNHVARPAGQEPVCLHCRALPATEPRAIARGDLAGARDAAASPLCGRKCLSDEGPCLLRACRADAARPDAEIVLAAHRQSSAHRAKRRNHLEKWRLRRLRQLGAPRANAP